jgi:hypothetical protein
MSAAKPMGGEVEVVIRNEYGSAVTPGTLKIGIMVYDKYHVEIERSHS